MKPFEIYNENNAPSESKEKLRQAKTDFGMIPNLEGVMAAAPALLESYVTGWAAFETTSLTPIERQVVYLTVNYENNCEYCVPWHTKLAQMAKMPEEEIKNLREGRALHDSKLNTLHQFTKTVVRTRGAIAPADLEFLFNAGYTQQTALEVVLGIAIKVMSNYTNAFAQTPLDKAVHSLRWRKPDLKEKVQL